MSKIVQELNQKIQKLLQSKEPLQALTLCEEGLQSFPNNVRLHLQRAQALINLEKIVQAREHLLSVQEKFPKNQAYLCKLGQIYIREKEFSKAKECFKSSYVLDSEHQATLKGLATLVSQELNLKLDEIEELLKQNSNEKAEHALLDIYTQICLETIQPFIKNKMTRLIKVSKSPILLEKMLQLLASKPEILTEQMLNSLIQLALNLKQTSDVEQLYKYFIHFTTINYPSAMIALRVLLKSDSDTLQEEIKQIQNKLNKIDALLFEIQIIYQIQGALQAYIELKRLLLHEEISTHISKLIPIFRSAGKTKEALTVLEYSLDFDVLPLHAKTTYLNTLIHIGNYRKALSFIDNTSLIEMETPLIKIKLTLLYHLGEYSEVIDFLENNQSEVVSNETILIWSLFESGEIITLEQITHWADILQLDKKTRKERTLHIRIFEDAMIQLQNDNAKQNIFSNVTTNVTQYYVKHLGSEQTSVKPQIPKSIIQYWDEYIPPPYIEQTTATFSSLQGVEYKLFSKRDALSYVRKNFEKKYMRALQLCKHPAEQADYFRLLYLVKNGGIYVDCDDIFTDDLNTLLSYHEGLILYKEPFGVGNNYIAAVPNHPVMVAALQRATHNLQAKIQENIWTKTGPGLLISVLGEYLSYMEQNNLKTDVRILSREKLLQHISPHTVLPYKGGKKAWLSTLQTR